MRGPQGFFFFSQMLQTFKGHVKVDLCGLGCTDNLSPVCDFCCTSVTVNQTWVVLYCSRTEKKFSLSCFPTADVYSSHSSLRTTTDTSIHIFPHTHIYTHIHTNALWAGGCSRRGGSDFGGWTRHCRAMLWKHLWPPNTKSFSFSSLFFSSLWQPDYLFHLSVSLTLSRSHLGISVSISSWESEICDKQENTFICYVISGRGGNAFNALFLCW